MVAPEVPTGGLIGQAILHHQPDGQGHDPMGVVGLGRGQIGHVGGEVAAAPRAVMLGVGEPDLTGPAPHGVAQIMQGAGPDPIPRARLAALRTGPMLVISTARDELRGRYYPGTEEAHTNPTRQRGECLRALAGAFWCCAFLPPRRGRNRKAQGNALGI